MIAAIFAWFGGSKIASWVQDLIVIVLVILIVAGSMWYYGHIHYEAGLNAQIAKDNAERAALIADTDKKTAELQAKASTAEKAYDDELAKTANYNSANPLEPVRLCNTATGSGSHLPKAGPSVSGATSSGSSTPSVQQMPSGDSGLRNGPQGRDIAGLLETLAESADEVSASLREYQNR